MLNRIMLFCLGLIFLGCNREYENINPKHNSMVVVEDYTIGSIDTLVFMLDEYTIPREYECKSGRRWR